MRKSSPPRWDWASAILLVFMLQTSAARLVITNWTEYLFFTQSLTALGLILGLALGSSSFQKRTVRLLVMCYSTLIIPWQLTVSSSDHLLSERLASVGGRLYYSLVQFFQREAVEDGLLFVAFISIVVWFLSLISGFWWSRYHNYLVAVLPSGVFIAIIHHYDQLFTKRLWLLAIYLLLAMLLLGRLYYLKNHELWKKQRIFQTQENTFDLMLGGIVTAILFIVVTWTIPASAAGWESAIQTWNRFTRPWRNMQEWFSNAVEPLNAPPTQKNADFYYGNSLSLGSGTSQAATVLFTVTPPKNYEELPRLYWRGYIYDSYQNGQWTNSFAASQDYFATEDNFTIPGLESRIDVRFTVKTLTPHSLLYTASQPVWVSRPGTIRKSTEATGENDIVSWSADPALKTGESYTVRSALADPFIQDLQEAGTEYPEWVSARYLQLPDDFSPRMRTLAEEITQDQSTPFDKAAAITRYLRAEIEYVNPLPDLPTDVDSIEWVLFESKQGFCNYYATIEVLMLRSLGIPARMAVGFAWGEFDEEQEVYIVRGLNAHAWPEVFFPGIGWIEFEPTANQDPLIRLNRPTNSDAPTPLLPGNFLPLEPEEPSQNIPGEQMPEIDPSSSTVFNTLLTYVLYLSILGALATLLFFMNRRYAFIETLPVRLQSMYERNGGQAPSWLKNWVRWNALTGIQRAFETINRSLRLLGETPAISLTPAERASKLTDILPKAASHIDTLSREHQTALFTPTTGNAQTARQASLTIWLYALQARFQKIGTNLSDRFN